MRGTRRRRLCLAALYLPEVKGRGRLVTGVEVEDSVEGVLPRSRYDFNSLGEVYLLDIDEAEEIEVIRPAEPWG